MAYEWLPCKALKRERVTRAEQIRLGLQESKIDSVRRSQRTFQAAHSGSAMQPHMAKISAKMRQAACGANVVRYM